MASTTNTLLRILISFTNLAFGSEQSNLDQYLHRPSSGLIATRRLPPTAIPLSPNWIPCWLSLNMKRSGRSVASRR